MNIVTFISLLVVLLIFLYLRKVSKLKIIFISKNNFGVKRSEVELFWGRFKSICSIKDDIFLPMA
jgi:hypothetical protein